MNTGNCRYPEHHSPAAGPFALLGAIAIGAVVIAFWHAVIVALVVITILACLAGMVFLLIHNHGSGYDPELEQRAAIEQRQAVQLAATQRAAIEAPAVHNHLHLHGVDADQMAEAVRKAISR